MIRAYLNYSTTLRAKDLHLFQTLSSIVIVIPVNSTLFTFTNRSIVIFLIRVYLSNQGYLKDLCYFDNSTAFRAKDLHLFQTLSSIVIVIPVNSTLFTLVPNSDKYFIN